MKILLLGGFLGSGKTTILMQLARFIVEQKKNTCQTPLVILENEIGEVSVDSKMLQGYQVRELFSGCICCTLAGDMTEAIHQIHKTYDPAFLLIEATGVAMPGKIAETIKKFTPMCEELLTITIADASRWDEIMDCMDVFFENQMKCGDIMLLNKIDLVEKDKLAAILDRLKRMNPNAARYAISAKDDISFIAEKLTSGKNREENE